MALPDKIYLFVNDIYQNVVDDIDTDVKSSFLKFVDNNVDNANKYFCYIKVIKDALQRDLQFFFDSDPAANSFDEIKITYPGFLAISYHRIAHPLYLLGYKVESRFISELAHKLTGIDIHPGATIGVPFFIDHGTGIVIGETAIIGQRVKMYQGVTLGALSLSRGHMLQGVKRHPTVGNDVTIYSGVSVLGDTKIGDDVTLGSNVFITEDVPPHTRVTIGKPALIFKSKNNNS